MLSVVATPSVGSPTTSTAGWPAPRRTARRTCWCRFSFDRDGEALLVATPADSPTGRNLAATRAVRLGLGHTRDVSMIDGAVEVLEIEALPQERADRFAARTGFDPRAAVTQYRWFRISPRRIQAWREVNELPDRVLMREGRWLV
ncbi:MAG TPA: hypothetical protein VGV86_16885 [Acidimicrobiales bacterium]|nr:hypothetical protein [Acidimicrobiales bacterium]